MGKGAPKKKKKGAAGSEDEETPKAGAGRKKKNKQGEKEGLSLGGLPFYNLMSSFFSCLRVVRIVMLALI